LVRSIPNVAAHYDQPFGNSSAVPAFYCARMAKLDGGSHILAGDGGDELFGGNTRYAKERVFGLWSGVPALLRGPLLEPLLDNPLTHAIPGVRKGASYVRQARVPMPDRMQTYNLLMRLGLNDLLTPEFLARVDSEGPRTDQRKVWAEIGNTRLLDRMLAFDWRYTLAENDLPKVVGTTQLAGVNVGFPLLDDRLVDFSMQLPPNYKLRGFKLRWFFKEALRGFLPDEILTKKKHGFGLPFGPWTLKHTGLKALAQESLNSMVERGLVRHEFVRRLFTEFLPAHPGYYGEMVWILMMLEQWLRRHAPGYRV
jgi:asparagine synthase (glutamine-hydrolysing)